MQTLHIRIHRKYRVFHRVLCCPQNCGKNFFIIHKVIHIIHTQDVVFKCYFWKNFKQYMEKLKSYPHFYGALLLILLCYKFN